jgi:hypothetical protein
MMVYKKEKVTRGMIPSRFEVRHAPNIKVEHAPHATIRLPAINVFFSEQAYRYSRAIFMTAMAMQYLFAVTIEKIKPSANKKILYFNAFFGEIQPAGITLFGLFILSISTSKKSFITYPPAATKNTVRQANIIDNPTSDKSRK